MTLKEAAVGLPREEWVLPGTSQRRLYGAETLDVAGWPCPRGPGSLCCSDRKLFRAASTLTQTLWSIGS